MILEGGNALFSCRSRICIYLKQVAVKKKTELDYKDQYVLPTLFSFLAKTKILWL